MQSQEPSLRIALLGCGKIGTNHLKAYAQLPQAQVSIFDTNAEAMHAVAHTFRRPELNAVDEAFSRSRFDAVDICTPSLTHTPLVLEALRAGQDVLCEKPLCTSLSDARAIHKAVRASSRFLMVAYLYRFAPVFRFVKEVLDEGILGRPYSAHMKLGGPGSHATWKHRRDEGGGAKFEKLVHLLDLTQWFFGSVRSASVVAEEMRFEERVIRGERVFPDAEDYVLLKTKTAGNVEVLLEADLTSKTYTNYVEIQAEHGSLLCSILREWPVVISCVGKRGRFKDGVSTVHFPYSNFAVPQLAHFLRGVRHPAEQNAHGVEETVNILEVLSQGGD